MKEKYLITLKILAFILLSISICFNFFQWVYEYTIFGYKIYSQNINIRPSLITTLFSIFLFGGFILRNIKIIMNDSIKIIFYILDLFFFAGFIAMFTDGQTNIFGFSSQSILFFTIILMYVGIRSILRYVILIFIACSFLFISKVNEAMGTWGSIYIICAFASFAIQTYTNILPEAKFIKNEYLVEGEEEKEEEKEELDDNYIKF